MNVQTAIIEKVSIIALNTSEVTFKTPGPFPFIAGQYITVTLPSLKQLPQKEQFHDFSIASSPEDTGHIKIAIRNSQSNFKKELLRNDRQVEVFIDGPKGTFTLPENPGVPVVFIAGGIGITPFLSMIRHIVMSKIPLKPTLFYYNRSRETAPYLAELEEYGRLINLTPVFSEITEKEASAYIQARDGEGFWYLAGPRGLVKTAREILTKLHVEDRFIKSEEFSGYV